MKNLRGAVASFFLILLMTLAASAETLDVEIMETSQGTLDTCSIGQVAGLKAGADGFLAVRSGPGTDYPELDRLSEGDLVWVFETQGEWQGVIHGTDQVDCSPVEQTVPLNKTGKKGWIHGKWVKPLAG